MADDDRSTNKDNNSTHMGNRTTKGNNTAIHNKWRFKTTTTTQHKKKTLAQTQTHTHAHTHTFARPLCQFLSVSPGIFSQVTHTCNLRDEWTQMKHNIQTQNTHSFACMTSIIPAIRYHRQPTLEEQAAPCHPRDAHATRPWANAFPCPSRNDASSAHALPCHPWAHCIAAAHHRPLP